MAQKTKAANPGTIYITFGLVAAVSLIMSTFIGTGLAIWYPSLDKPELTLALPFTFMIRIFFGGNVWLSSILHVWLCRNNPRKMVWFFL